MEVVGSIVHVEDARAKKQLEFKEGGTEKTYATREGTPPSCPLGSRSARRNIKQQRRVTP
jgi:hypothetical protein